MRYISLFLFVVVIGISSVAEGQEDIIDPGHHPGEPIEHSVDILDEFRSSILESFERAAQDIGESFGHMVEEHSNEAVILCGRMVREAEQQRMEFEQTMDMVPREVLEAAQQATEGLVGENEELEAQLLAAQEQSDLEAAVQQATEGLVGEDEVKERISEAVQQATEGLVGEDEVKERISEAVQQATESSSWRKSIYIKGHAAGLSQHKVRMDECNEKLSSFKEVVYLIEGEMQCFPQFCK